MVEARLKYVMAVKGGRHHYVRHPALGGLVPLPGRPGDYAFQQAYARALEMIERAPRQPAQGTVRDIVNSYRASAEFADKAELTKRDYRRVLDWIAEALGAYHIAGLTRVVALEAREVAVAERGKRFGNYVVQMASILLSFAADRGHIPVNPLARVKKLRMGPGYEPWPEHVIEAALEAMPAHLSLAIDLVLATGVRGGDLCRLARTDYGGGEIRVRTGKTRELLDIPIQPALRARLEALPLRLGPILRNAAGAPYTENALRKAIYDWFCARGEKPYSLHGLRYAAAARMEDAGAKPWQVQDILGHRTYQMAVKYMEKRRRASASAGKLQTRGRKVQTQD